MADSTSLNAHQTKQFLIFTYGTLKQDFPNYKIIEELIRHNDASYRGTYITNQPYPLVIGPYGIPYLINLPSSGGSIHRVKGEVYSVSTRGVAVLDEFEGLSIGHYERLPIEVMQLEGEGSDGNGGVLVEAEAYYAHRSFGEKMWEKRRRIGLCEYNETNKNGYVRVENRSAGASILREIALFLPD